MINTRSEEKILALLMFFFDRQKASWTTSRLYHYNIQKHIFASILLGHK